MLYMSIQFKKEDSWSTISVHAKNEHIWWKSNQALLYFASLHIVAQLVNIAVELNVSNVHCATTMFEIFWIVNYSPGKHYIVCVGDVIREYSQLKEWATKLYHMKMVHDTICTLSKVISRAENYLIVRSNVTYTSVEQPWIPIISTVPVCQEMIMACELRVPLDLKIA